MKTGTATIMSLVLLASCVPHRPYWVQEKEHWSSTSKSLTPRTPETPSSYDLQVIEFDDNGDKWAPNQTHAAVEMIRKANKPIVVVYLHGWKHNADEDDNDFKKFKKLLEKSAKLQPNRRVCGVYIGWRGDIVPSALSIPTLGLSCVARQISLYNRMATADRLAHGIPLPQTLNQIVSVAKLEKKGVCVLMGHSLGARILENVTTRSLTESADKINTKTHPLADLILLVNPASDAQRARQAMLATEWPYEKRPAIILLHSETDWATGWLYTDAMKLGKAMRATRQYPMAEGRHDSSQRTYITQTATTVPNMVSHIYREDSSDPPVLEDAGKVFEYNMRTRAEADERFVMRDKNNKLTWAYLKPNDANSNKLYSADQKACLYWTLQLPDHVLHGHGGSSNTDGIFNDKMMDLFAALYGMTAGQGPVPTNTGASVIESAMGARVGN